MRTIKVSLAGREYEVQELPARRNAEWRARLRQPFTLAACRELLLAYAPQLRDALDDPDLYESDLVAAFMEVRALGNPFGLAELQDLPGEERPAT